MISNFKMKILEFLLKDNTVDILKNIERKTIGGLVSIIGFFSFGYILFDYIPNGKEFVSFLYILIYIVFCVFTFVIFIYGMSIAYSDWRYRGHEKYNLFSILIKLLNVKLKDLVKISLKVNNNALSIFLFKYIVNYKLYINETYEVKKLIDNNIINGQYSEFYFQHLKDNTEKQLRLRLAQKIHNI